MVRTMTEIPTSGNLKSGDSLFGNTPLKINDQITSHPPPPSDKHKLIQALILSQGNGLGHYMKSYMKYRPSQFTFMVIFVSDELHAKMPQKKN